MITVTWAGAGRLSRGILAGDLSPGLRVEDENASLRGPGWQSISLTSPEPVSQSAFSLEKITVSNACKHYINTEWDEIKEGKEGWISFLWLSIRLMKNDISTHSLWIHNILRPRLGWFRLNDNPIHSIRRELSEVGNQIICREYSSRKWILGWCSISAAAPT